MDRWPQYFLAILIIMQLAVSLFNGVTLVTPACADHSQRLNDQFNSALLLAALLAAGGFWRRTP